MTFSPIIPGKRDYRKVAVGCPLIEWIVGNPEVAQFQTTVVKRG
jgi:hypothetical protein